jgi:predicted permease
MTSVAVIAIALGIGANTALFSFANALFFRPLAVADPARLISLFHVRVDQPASYSSFAYPDYLELRDQNDVLSGLAAWSTIEMNLGRPWTERIEAQIVSGDYFDVLGVRAALGRTFRAEEDRTPDTYAVAVLSDALWRRRFGSDPNVIGRSIPLNGRDVTVVGVAPATFRGLELASDPMVWVPLMMHRTAMPSFRAFGTELFANRGTHWLELTGRLAAGVTRDRAMSALRAIADRQAVANPETNRGWTVAAIPAQEGRLGAPAGRPGVVRLTGLLLAVVGLVLVIVCANVANLLLVRAVARRREIGVRLAIGAGRGHVIGQMLTESLLLAMAGGGAGVTLAALAASIMPSLDLTASLPGLDPRLDVRVLAYAVGLTVMTGVAFGLLPAHQASRTAVMDSLKPGAQAALAGSRRWPLRHALVILQVALCMVLLTGAGLTLRTLQNLRSLPLGFDPSNLWVATVDLTQREETPESGPLIQQEVLRRVRALPGVEGAEMGFMTPFASRRMANDFFWIPPGAADRQRTNLDMNVVGPEYFDIMRIPVIRGRRFQAADRSGAPDVAIVNRALAERLWPQAEAVGERIWSWNPRGDDRGLLVVGVVENGRYYRSWRTDARPFLFVPASQWYQGDMALHVRGARLTVVDLRRAILEVAPDVPSPNPVRAADAMASAMAAEQTGARVIGAFALLALAIAAIGIYAVVAFTVGERTHEIGIRVALGAGRSAVLGVVILSIVKPLLIGVSVGWLAAMGLTRLMTALLFGVRPTDPLTYLTVAVTLLGAGVAASYLPARRATRADPLQALRTG